MKIKMIGLYGCDIEAYFRTIGCGCFDFVSDKELGSDLSEEDCNKVLKSESWYCKLYGATKLEVVQ